jgi:hypothetical protein
MKTLPHLKRNLIKRIFALFSFTTALFVFQACYGMEIPPDQTVKIEGLVKSKKTDLPISGIEVSLLRHDYDTVYWKEIIDSTDEKGEFSTTAWGYEDWDEDDSLHYVFKDVDSTLNGSFAELDTIIYPDFDKDTCRIEILLEEL